MARIEDRPEAEVLPFAQGRPESYTRRKRTMAHRSKHTDPTMETTTSFNLNHAIQRWRENLCQSPAFCSENLDELEVHLRDSVMCLQSRGLSEDEAFLVAVRRLGQADALG